MEQFTPRPHTQARFDQVITLGLQGLPQLQIAQKTSEHLTTVQRWLKNAGIPAPAGTKDVGDEGEKLVVDQLKALGMDAHTMAFGHPFDIQCGKLKIEVKTASSSRPTKQNKQVAMFNLSERRGSLYGHHYQKDYSASCDFVVFVWIGDVDIEPRFWIKPVSECPATAKITLHPHRPAYSWGAAENAWHLVAAAFGSQVSA